MSNVKNIESAELTALETLEYIAEAKKQVPILNERALVQLEKDTLDLLVMVHDKRAELSN